MNDLTGEVFGRLTVVEYAHTSEKYYWVCRCECGKQTLVYSSNLLSGRTQSCGCLGSESSRERFTTHGHSIGGEQTPTYKTWAHMLGRCENPGDHAYARYGGRGIRVCTEWHEFENFLRDMGEKPEGLTLDRIDNDSDYYLKNCHWATYTEQNRNRRNSYVIEFNGKARCLAEWAERIGMAYGTLRTRLDDGWTVERALTTPTQKNGKRSRRESDVEI